MGYNRTTLQWNEKSKMVEARSGQRSIIFSEDRVLMETNYHTFPTLFNSIQFLSQCAVAISKAYDIGWVKPFLEESELSQLEVSEGIGKIHGTAKDDLIYLENDDRYYFDFALCIPYIDKRSLKDQHLKIWHKGRMVYQLSKNEEIIFNIDKANSNIGIYNILLVPLNYFVIGIGILYICLFLINFKTKTT